MKLCDVFLIYCVTYPVLDRNVSCIKGEGEA